MRRIDEVKNKKMKNVKYIEVIDKKRIRVVFKNNAEIVLKAASEDFGYDSGMYIEEDNVNDSGNKNEPNLEDLLGRKVMFIGERNDGMNKGIIGILQKSELPKAKFEIKVLNNLALKSVGVLDISEIEVID